MRPHNHLRILATAATVAALSAPAAHAEAISDGGGGRTLTNHNVAAAPHHPATADWPLIAVAGGTVVLVGAGLGGSRRLSSRRASAAQAEAPHLV
jgi:hypothetical protein